MKRFFLLAIVAIAGVCTANGQENQAFTKVEWSHHISSIIGSSSTQVGGMVGVEYLAIRSDYVDKDASIDLGIGASVASFVLPNSDMGDKILADLLFAFRWRVDAGGYYATPFDWRLGIGYDFGKNVWRMKSSFGLGLDWRFISVRPALYVAMPLNGPSWGLIDVFRGVPDPNTYGLEISLGVRF